MGYTVYIRSPYRPDDVPQSRRPPTAPQVPVSNVLGVFGLSVRTRERDLEDEFGKYGDVEKVIIVYDQRVSRSGSQGWLTPDGPLARFWLYHHAQG
jgi:transformer-2 protein